MISNVQTTPFSSKPIEMSPRFVLGRENVPCVAEVVNRSPKADCTDFTPKRYRILKRQYKSPELITDRGTHLFVAKIKFQIVRPRKVLIRFHEILHVASDQCLLKL